MLTWLFLVVSNDCERPNTEMWKAKQWCPPQRCVNAIMQLRSQAVACTMHRFEIFSCSAGITLCSDCLTSSSWEPAGGQICILAVTMHTARPAPHWMSLLANIILEVALWGHTAFPKHSRLAQGLVLAEGSSAGVVPGARRLEITLPQLPPGLEGNAG